MVVFEPFLLSQTKKNVVKIGPLLTKLSGSAHGPILLNEARCNIQAGHLDLLNEISKLSPSNREMTFQSLVRPQLEFASAVWDPHTKDKTHKVEMVQRPAAQWTLSDYARTTSDISLQSQFNCQTLEERRSMARLCLFYKIVYGLVAVPPQDYMQPTQRYSRYCHSMTFRQIHTGKDYYEYSFFPLAIVQWNALPASVAVAPSLEIFKAAVGQHQHSNPKQYTAYFNMIFNSFRPAHFHQFQVLSSRCV